MFIISVVRESPPMLIIFYWILVLLWAIGAFVPYPEAYRGRVTGGVALVLFAIIGFYLFGNPAS